jgi:hypothetical protein
MPAFDVGTHGRMAVLADPEGATFGLWQPIAMQGAGRARESGAALRVELASRDSAAAATFYQTVLGWQITARDIPNVGLYRDFEVDGTAWGGLLQMTPEWGDLPSHWAVYWQVADVDSAVQQTQAAGGSVCVPPFDVPGLGRLCGVRDPLQAMAYVIAPADAAAA